ncbi:MAG: hypothetical protein ABW185_00325 [Sedimenticola sp.]
MSLLSMPMTMGKELDAAWASVSSSLGFPAVFPLALRSTFRSRILLKYLAEGNTL